MSADQLDPHADLTDRLAALGRQSVDPALQSEHLTALAGVRSGSPFRTALAGRLKIGAGVMAGFLIGATGLTTAGALGPVQSVAATAIEQVTPLQGLPESASTKAKAKGLEKAAKSKAAAKGGEDGDAAGGEKVWGPANDCPEPDVFKNRGQFLKAAKDEDERAGKTFAEARQSDCGKGIDALTDNDGEVTEQEAPKAEGAADDTSAEDEAQNGAGNGRSADKGKASEAGKPEDAGAPADSAKPDDTPDGAKPATAPPEAATEHADDDNAKLPEPRTPGEGATADDETVPPEGADEPADAAAGAATDA